MLFLRSLLPPDTCVPLVAAFFGGQSGFCFARVVLVVSVQGGHVGAALGTGRQRSHTRAVTYRSVPGTILSPLEPLQ